MKWYYKIQGGHVHVRVFMNGAKCGDLCFRVEEFEQVRREQHAIATITFINETLAP
jgi:hypothetical protein